MTNLKLRKYNGDLIAIASGRRLSLEENTRYDVVFDGEIEPCQMYFGGVAIAPDPSGCLSIRPGHWVGDIELRVEAASESLSISVRIIPREEKLPDTLWVSMLQDLESWLPGVTTGVEGGREGQVGDAGVSVPLIAEALLPLVPAFENAIRALCESPRQLDVSILEDVPLRMIRRVDRETLNWVSRHPEIHAHLDPWKSLDLKGPQPTLSQRRTIDVLDHPANRYISWLVRRVAQVLMVTAERLVAVGDANQTDDNQFWCRSRSKRLLDGSVQLKKVWRHSFLSDVPSDPLTEAALQVVLDDPIYMRVHKIGRLFLNPLFRLKHDDARHQAAVRPSFTIYELWCFLAVGKQFKDLLPHWQWNTLGLKKLLGPEGTGAGAFHRAISQDGECLEILFNATFVSYFSRAGKSRWTLSGARRPDIVVSYKPQQGEGRWISLDAKYRVGRDNLANAFSSVHIYRDALRYEGFGGICRASVLLSPSCSVGTEEWFSVEYLETYREGVWELKPGQSASGLGEWLSKLLLNSEMVSAHH